MTRAGLGALLGARARLRWVHLILGGALLMPYFLLTQVGVGVAAGGVNALASPSLILTAYGVALPLTAASACLFGLVRPLSVTAVRALCGVPGELLAQGPARSWAARGRAAVWWTLHLGVGALVSALTLALPPWGVVLIALPGVGGPREADLALGPFTTEADPWLGPLLGAGLLGGLVLCAAGAGALLARVAPVLLGPAPADRLAAAEERAADLAVRNRLARELHDAVGHALSAVTLQAAAARRMLERDPVFVRDALAAIEDTTRRTVGELDAVLGLLREGDPARADTAPSPTLARDLEGLLGRGRASGTTLTLHQDPGPLGDWAALPAITSREAYRIVQEGLSNALRHGGGPVELRIRVRSGEEDRRGAEDRRGEGHRRGEHGEGERHRELEITMSNPPAGPGGPEPRTTGGRGLRGCAERAALLGGRVEAGPYGDHWRLRAVLPLAGAGAGR
ncbi:histidine kinase [Streptomyces sp. NPDC047014]|uniref:sensor histidine kinase n=1 Tax=Streptomyces sp. NPDC047014 TaxID=3155736 RepID=UPI0033EA7507